MAKKFDKVTSLESLEAKLAEMREAQAIYSKFTQEQVDKIFFAAATAASVPVKYTRPFSDATLSMPSRFSSSAIGPSSPSRHGTQSLSSILPSSTYIDYISDYTLELE